MIERDEKVINAPVTLLESKVGYEINLCELLKMYQLHDLRFAVNCCEHNPAQPSRDKWVYEKLFDDACEAVEFFEQKRREYKLGDDIEVALIKNRVVRKNKNRGNVYSPRV